MVRSYRHWQFGTAEIPHCIKLGIPSRELEGKVAELKVIGGAYSSRRVHDPILDGTHVPGTL